MTQIINYLISFSNDLFLTFRSKCPKTCSCFLKQMFFFHISFITLYRSLSYIKRVRVHEIHKDGMCLLQPSLKPYCLSPSVNKKYIALVRQSKFCSLNDTKELTNNLYSYKFLWPEDRVVNRTFSPYPNAAI